LLVPADRFHGRVDAVLEALSKKIDPEAQIGYDGIDISRSLTAIFASSNHIRSTVPDNFRALKGDV